MEHLFIYIPVPLYSYSTEVGHTFGLAKFNVINLYKEDTITKPSKISEVFTMSTEGRINVPISTELVFRNNKYVLLSYFNYKKTPEYIFGIGNDVKIEDIEEIKTDRIKFYTVGLYEIEKDFYAGVGIDLASYFSIQTDSNSFLVTENVSGLEGGPDIGIGLAGAWDTRDNRYNSYHGHYILTTCFFYPEFFEANTSSRLLILMPENISILAESCDCPAGDYHLHEQGCSFLRPGVDGRGR